MENSNTLQKVRKAKKIICLKCFNEIEGEHMTCPSCGARLTKEARKLSFAIEDNKNNIFRSTEFLAKFVDLPVNITENAVNGYGYNGFKNAKPNNAKVSLIRVRGLFGYLNYDIKLNHNNSIIIAPNGYGKTTIFNLLNFLLNPTPLLFNSVVKMIPFVSFEAIVNGKKVTLTKNEKKEEFAYSIKGIDKKVIIPYYQVEETPSRTSDRLYESLKGMLIILEKAEIYSDIEFIKTNRVYPRTDKIDNPTSVYVRQPVFHWDIPIIECNHILAEKMLEARSKYRELVEKTKDSLPEKFLSSSSKKNLNFKEFRKKWDIYYSYLIHLSEFGLLETENDLTYINKLTEKQYNKLLEEKGNFLGIYLDEYQKTLVPFYELDSKLLTFKEIIESRHYNNKTFFYHKNGFGFKRGSSIIALDYLSSGEKNDVIMYFNLIFRTRDHSIILIDEPEISLHINWQLNYINNINKALSNKCCQVLISTHSPEIISNKEELLAKIENK